jgi:hypothetical protein
MHRRGHSLRRFARAVRSVFAIRRWPLNLRMAMVEAQIRDLAARLATLEERLAINDAEKKES